MQVTTEIVNPETQKPDGSTAITTSILSIEAQRILQRVMEYAVRSIKQNPQALAYLPGRKIVSPELLDEFQIGYLDSSFADKLPGGREGAELRRHLKDLGILTQSGRVFFQGCIIFPVYDKDGRLVQINGRRIESRTGLPDHGSTRLTNHLNLAQPLRGFFNHKAFISKEIILCESVIDALSFWVNGFRNVTCVLGINGLTPDHLRTFSDNKTERVFIAYDNDPAGNERALEHSSLLVGLGVHCLRVEFPKAESEKKMDANEYIQRVKMPAESLRLLLSAAVPVGGTVAKASDTSLFSGVLRSKSEKIHFEKAGHNYLFFAGNRTYRITGLEKNNSLDSLRLYIKVSLDQRPYSDNNVDLHANKDRRNFIKNAAAELELEEEIIKKDILLISEELEILHADYLQSLIKNVVTEVVMTEADRALGLSLLMAPDIKKQIVRDIQGLGIVGEELNSLAAYISATSRITDKPLAVVFQSSSGAGKSTVMDAVLKLLPPEDVVRYSAMTGQALFYMDKNLKNKILVIEEEEGAQKVSYSLKLLQSEGKISIASTGKNPTTGKMETHDYAVEGPVMIMISTTSIDIDPELLNRSLVLTVNETREQTRRIQDRQRRMETLEGMFMKAEEEEIMRRHHAAQRLLRDIYVNNIFAGDLNFPDTSHRMRRDNKKYLTILRMWSIIRQYQRPLKTTKVKGMLKEYIESAFEDLEDGQELAIHIFGTTLDEVPPVTRTVLEESFDLAEKLCKERKIDMEDLRLTRKEIREALGISDAALRVHLPRLLQLDYFLEHRARRGQSFVYEILYRGEGRGGERFAKWLADLEKIKKKYKIPPSDSAGAA